MKAVLIALTVMASQIGFAQGLANGSFEGNGLWKSDKSVVRGQYTVKTVISGNSIEANYNRGEHGSYKWKFETKQTQAGFFDVMSKGKKIFI